MGPDPPARELRIISLPVQSVDRNGRKRENGKEKKIWSEKRKYARGEEEDEGGKEH